MSTRLRTRSVVMLLSLVMLVSESVSSVASPSGAASPLGLSAAAPSRIAGCALLPSSNVWNTPVSNLPVAANSAAVVAAIGAGSPLHPDFGSGTWAGSPIGIPYSVVPSTQAGVSVHFSYSSESDHGPYPVPSSPWGPTRCVRQVGPRPMRLVCRSWRGWSGQWTSHGGRSPMPCA